MTWELAESGNEFITSVINGADLVPTFSAASVDDLRGEVCFKFIYLLSNLFASSDYSMNYVSFFFFFPLKIF